MRSNYEQNLIEMIQRVRRELLVRPLNLGGTSVGVGGPPGGFTGYLPQTRISYDQNEIALSGFMNGSVISGTLLDNLNHIRYRLGNIEAVTGSGASLTVRENDVDILSGVTVLNFIGADVIAADAHTVDITISGGGATGGHTIQDEGTPLTQRTGLNFIGNYVAATDDPSNNRTNVTITNPTAGHVIQEESSPLTQRANLNFVGDWVTASDDVGNNATVITVSGPLAGHVIQDHTSNETQRANLDFEGPDVTVTDDSGNNRTVVTISGGGARSLNDLTDVDLTTPPTDTQVLTYDDGSSSWKPADAGGSSGGYTEGAQVTRIGSNFTVGTYSYTPIQFDYELYDTDSIADLGSSNTRLTCQTAGVYLIIGEVQWAASSSGAVRYLQIYLNGTYVMSFGGRPIIGSDVCHTTVTTILNMSVNDYVQLRAYQDTGGDLDIIYYNGTNITYTPVFTMQRIG